MKRNIAVLLILCVGFFIYLEMLVISNENSYFPKQAEGILILGHSLEDGLVPGKWSVLRLEGGLELYQQGYGKMIIVSGGKGPRDTVPVAESMKEWLLEQGVDSEHVLVENRAANTYENMVYAKEICETANINNVVVVTNDFHAYRSFETALPWFDQVSLLSVKTPFDWQKGLAYIKEPFSLLKYHLIDKPKTMSHTNSILNIKTAF